MRITKVSVTRKFNLGSYENITLSAEAELAEKDNALEVWNILKDNAEMCFLDMQRKKQAQSQTNPKPATTQKQPEPTVCPKCGGKKKPDFKLCYTCWEAEKAGET